MGMTDRLVLSDAAWDRIAPLITGRPDQIGRDNRMFAEGMRVAALTNSLPAVRLSSHMGDASSLGVSGERDVRSASRKVPDDP